MKNPFITGTTKIGPLMLRDLVASDLVCLAKMGLDEQYIDLETLLAMVWMASEPVETIEQAVVDKTAATLAKEFNRNLPFGPMMRAKAWALEQQQMQEDARVEIIEQEGASNLPPN